jgi:hypothetical protein
LRVFCEDTVSLSLELKEISAIVRRTLGGVIAAVQRLRQAIGADVALYLRPSATGITQSTQAPLPWRTKRAWTARRVLARERRAPYCKICNEVLSALLPFSDRQSVCRAMKIHARNLWAMSRNTPHPIRQNVPQSQPVMHSSRP